MTITGAAAPGGVLLMTRGAQDAFEGPSKGHARRMRDAAIADASVFDADARLCITLRWRDRQTWQARRDGQWVDICVHRVDRDED